MTRMRIEERYVRHGRGRLRYLTVGEGPPLIMVHGYNGSAENFQTWYEDVGAVRTLVLPDLPGFGESTPLETRHDADNLSLAVSTVMAALDVDRVDLGGLCLGACVALAFMRRHPEMVDKLILHTPLLHPRLVQPRFHHQTRLFTSPLIYPGVVWLGRRRRVSDWYKRRFTEGYVPDDTGADMNFLNQCRCSARASRQWLRDGLRRDDLDVLRRRTNPTLVMVAADDNIVDIPGLRSALDGMPHVTTAIFGNASHAWSEDFVRRQNAVLRAFLAGQQIPPTLTGDEAAA